MTKAPIGPRSSLKPIGLAVLLCAWGLPAPAQDNSAGHDRTYRDLDWAPSSEVPAELRDDQCMRCDGRYLDPIGGEVMERPVEEADISATAGSSELVGDTVTFSDGVVLQQGYRRLSADSATLDRLDRSGRMEGNIELREPGILLRGEQASVRAGTGEASLENSRFVLHEQRLRGSADLLDRDAEGILHIHDGQLSFCAPEANDWLLRADQLELDTEEGLGVARGARIDIAGVPVFYSPWLQFPLDDRRRTGFLWPDIGSDTKGGIDMSVPVYFNLAPDYDLLYSPRYIQESVVNHDVKSRYLKR